MEKNIDIKSVDCYLAKSNPDTLNYYLVNHTKMVLNLGMRLADTGYIAIDQESGEKDKFMQKLALTLVLHDIGKMVGEIQGTLKRKNKKTKYPHKLYSWAYASKRIGGVGEERNSCIKSAILYHHDSYESNDKGIWSNDVLEYMKKDLTDMDEFYRTMSEYCVKVFGDNFDLKSAFPILKKDKYNSNENILQVPLYRHINIKGEDIEESFETDSTAQLIRAILIRADRLVSSDKYEDGLQRILDNDVEYMDDICSASEIDFKNIINDEFDYKSLFTNPNAKYDPIRLKGQFDILKKTSSANHNAIKACAGFGKTLLGLMWFFREKKRLLWVTSKNTIVLNTYYSIEKELKTLGLFDKVSIAAYYGGEIVTSNKTSIGRDNLDEYDILVTNIDSIVSRTAKNSMAHLMYNMYESNVVFDEYHEFKSKNAIFSAFVRLMYIRSYHTLSKTLLLSATASDFGCLWGNSAVNHINDSKVLFGDETKIKVICHTYNKNDKIKIPKGDILAITQTVPQARFIYIENKDQKGMLIHTRYTKLDKEKRIEEILSSHGNDKDKLQQRGLVVGTDIIGTGMDVSSRVVYDIVVSPEATIQRGCGRCSRFGEYKEIEYHACDIKGDTWIVKEEYTLELRKLWLDELTKLNNQVITKTKFYEVYEAFQTKHKGKIKEHYYQFFNESSEELEKILPYGTSLKKDMDKDVDHIGKNSYRGKNNSVYVTAKCTDGQQNWSDAILVDMRVIDEEGNYKKKRLDFMRHSPEKFKYPSEKDIVYQYKIKTGSVDECKKLAACSLSPIPLFDFVYDPELGLIGKKVLSK